MSESFQIYLTLKVFLEEFGDFDNLTEIIYFSRNIELPYIPQIGSDIMCNLHRNHNGRQKFTVKHVSIPLGYWTNQPLEKNYQLVESTEVMTEDRFKLSEIQYNWNVTSIKNLCDLCRINEWTVYRESEK